MSWISAGKSSHDFVEAIFVEGGQKDFNTGCDQWENVSNIGGQLRMDTYLYFDISRFSSWRLGRAEQVS